VATIALVPKKASKTAGARQAKGLPFHEGQTRLGEIQVAPIQRRDNRAAVTLGVVFSVIEPCFNDQTHGVLWSWIGSPKQPTRIDFQPAA
jgi:hypothetical protein